MARVPSNRRIPRNPKSCTCCAEPLPRYRNHWGLVWDDNMTGMCKTCLITIRDSVGYYSESNPMPVLPRKRQGSSRSKSQAE